MGIGRVFMAVGAVSLESGGIITRNIYDIAPRPGCQRIVKLEFEVVAAKDAGWS